MAASHTVLTITREAEDWLKEKGISYTMPSSGSRFPAPNEIRNVLDRLEDCKTEYTVSEQTWQAVVSDAQKRWTSLVVLEFHRQTGEEEIPHEFYFEKGWPELMEKILKKLSELCGPFVLVPNDNMEPILIIPDADAAETG